MAEFVTVMKERMRMCKTQTCSQCGLHEGASTFGLPCASFVIRYPEESEKIIMDWAAKHPVETMKDRFFRLFPNAELGDEGTPKCCPYHLGWEEIYRCNDFETCLQCWNRPYEEKETEKKGRTNK